MTPRSRPVEGSGPIFVCLLCVQDQERYGVWCHPDFSLISARSAAGVRRQVTVGRSPDRLAALLERTVWEARLLMTSLEELHDLLGEPFVADVQTIDDLIVPLAIVRPDRVLPTRILHESGQPLWLTTRGGDHAD